MNYYAGRQIVCLFPHLTFRSHFQLNYLEYTETKGRAVQKYLRRGYKLLDGGPHYIPVDGVEQPPLEPHIYWRSVGIHNETLLNLRRDQIQTPMWRCKVEF
ncbi:hypothetical protein RQP46_010035 [Phenoliferia psychrophenolica]